MPDRPLLTVSIDEATKILGHYISSGADLGYIAWSPEKYARVEEWTNEVQCTLEEIFSTSERATRFITDNVLNTESTKISEEEKQNLSIRGAFENRVAWLRRLRESLANYVFGESTGPDALRSIELICSRLHSVSRQLRQRHNRRPTLDVTDEYDVQDLLHALLRLFFDDIRPEDPSPIHAGASSRLDFVLKNEQIVIEVKKSRPTLKEKEVGEELIVDIERYQAHPDCKLLYCFVYDPDGYIRNPRGLERDLSKTYNQLPVKVFIAPKDH